jgi:hypothetical protein
MEHLKSFFKGAPLTEDAEQKLRIKAWQTTYQQISDACDAEFDARAGSKKKTKSSALRTDTAYLDLLWPDLIGTAIVFDHSQLLSRVSGDISDFKTWHRCSFVCCDGLLYFYPAAIFISTKPLAMLRLANVRIARATVVTSGTTCL